MRIVAVSRRDAGRVAVLVAVLALVGWLIGWLVSPGVVRGTTAAPLDRYTLRGVATTQRALALTFDISWGTEMPAKVLAILVQDHVPATFFLSAPWAQANPDYVHQLVADGFQVESHGWAHVNYSSLGYRGVVANIRRANQVLTSLTGHPVTYVRPPNGDFNATALAAAHSLGYTVVTWGTDSLDWMNPGVSVIIHRVVSRAHPGDIVLLHASDTCKQTNLALPAIIHDLRQQGYRLVTMAALLRLGTPEYRG